MAFPDLLFNGVRATWLSFSQWNMGKNNVCCFQVCTAQPSVPFLVLVPGKAHVEGSHATGWKDPGSLNHCLEESSPEYPPALHRTVLWATYYICKALIIFQCWLMSTRLPSLKGTRWVFLPGNALGLAVLYSYWTLLTCAYTPESITDSVLAMTLGHMPVSSSLISSHEQIPGPAQGQHNSGHADITAH